VIGAEALLRWRHHPLGPVPPSRFIPVAEDSREIMIAIGEWVLEQACQQACAWREAGHQPLPISVNVSVVQLRHQRFLEHVKEVLERFQLPPEQLQLELTESLLMSDVAGASNRVHALKDLGLRIAIDDFGTGYSSLSYLKHLPVGELKIDQSFVRNIESDGDNAPIVQAIIRMGQSLNLNVIAEGVENPYAVNFLTDNGCDGAQGYYYSKPISPGAFESQFLASAH
jgi:EAL domain-containing protein (putative c-di-GMP-specific phosphodiesterase class I)